VLLIFGDHLKSKVIITRTNWESFRDSFELRWLKSVKYLTVEVWRW